MDKQKVLHAYRRGLLSTQECAQILGIDSVQVLQSIDDYETAKSSAGKQVVSR